MNKLIKPTAGPSNRQLRVGEQIRKVVAECMYRGDFQVTTTATIPVTITEVRMSPDLKHAFIFVMPLGGVMQQETLEQLDEISIHIRKYINKKLALKNSPILHFELDTSFEEASKIENLLKSPEVSEDLKK